MRSDAVDSGPVAPDWARVTGGETDARLAARLAHEAGAILVHLQAESDFKAKALGAKGDRIANDFLMRELRTLRPDDGILCEEERDNHERLGCGRVWIVDPLDGTREYSERRDDWAVHVALAIDGVATLGAVSLPAFGVTYASDDPPALKPANAPLRMLVSRTRPAQEAMAVAEALGAELRPLGSAGAKAMAVLSGDADIYLHTGGQYEWDNCAPVAVAKAAGLHVSRADGAQLIYNNRDTYLPDLLICRPDLAEDVIAKFKAL